ncbi:MAG: Blue-light-activated protein [Syntrophaceae bacterium PtaU1.Bin231]|nr:MAG: Blue-light-activated protein [Syntrophaceae bacterium PtaU1.Bin231]
MKDTPRTMEQLLEELRQARNAIAEMKSHEASLERAQGALMESEQLLYSILEGSPIPTFVIGSDHRIIYWNKALQELTGIPAEEVVGTTQHWRAFYSEERPSLADVLVDQTIQDIRRWYREKCRKSKLIEEAYEATDFFAELGSGGKWLRFTAAIIRDSAGNLRGAVETLEDITERRRAEEELLRMQKMESLSTMAEGVAHEFNRLLSAILGKVVWAKLSAGEEDSAIEEVLSLAEKFGHQAKELTHQLLTFSMSREPCRSPAPLAPLVREEASVLLQGSDVICNFFLPEDLWTADIDVVQIRRVIRGLIRHALQQMPTGGILTIRAENTQVTADEAPIAEGRYIRLTVKDDGAGLSQEELRTLFDPQFSAKSGPKDRRLGLALCYSIARKHGGLIRAESEKGKGTSLQLWLPIPQKTEKEKPEEAAVKSDRRILMQETDDKVRHTSRIILNFLHCQAEFAASGEETVARFSAAQNDPQPYAAVLIAWSADRDEEVRRTIARLREVDTNVRILVTVDYRDTVDEAAFLSIGASGMATKPFGVEDTGNALRNLFL